jgi:hypothetical protein
MAYSFEDLVTHERRRWMRPDAHLFTKSDAQGGAVRDAAHWRELLLHPDHKLWNFHVRTNAQRRSPAEQAPALGGQGFVAQLVRLQTRQDSLQRAFVELKQQRQRERAFERAESERLKRHYDAAWDKFIAAFNRHWDTCRKAGFDPNQPRMPASNPDGGQWTSGGGGISDPRVLSDAAPDDDWKPGAHYAQDRSRRYSVILEDEEARGGHVISKHVGKTDDDLAEVLRRNYYVGLTTYNFQDAEGSFTDVRSANDFVNQTLNENQAIVDLVASGRSDEEMIEHRFGYPTGKEAHRANVDSEPYIRSTYAVRVIIRHDSHSERGYSVLTAFPINKLRKERAP